MNYSENQCDHAGEMISFVYNEGTAQEIAQFSAHLKTCIECQTELESFGGVRALISDWKLEALSSVAQPGVEIPMPAPRTKSAVAAVREFFELSPLWLKGATALATVLFFVLVGLAVARLNEQPTKIVRDENRGPIYTEADMNQAIKKALEEQQAVQDQTMAKGPEILTDQPTSQKRNSGKFSSVAKGRRPLTKWEREQLAVDLRLIERSDEIGLELLSEPINK